MTKQTRLLLAGAFGGGVGALLGEACMRDFTTDSRSGTVVHVGIVLGVVSSMVAFGVRFAIARNCNHRCPAFGQSASAIIAGALAGAVGGACAQVVYLQFETGVFQHIVGRTLCWALAGLLLGSVLSLAIPNMSQWRGGLFGCLGGLLGGAVFLALGASGLPEWGQRLGAFGGLGALIGLAVSIAESLETWKGAVLEIAYGPKEIVRMALGLVPITFGGSSSDTIYVSGMPRCAVSVTSKAGTVYVARGESTPIVLRDRSTIKVGSVVATVCLI